MLAAVVLGGTTFAGGRGSVGGNLCWRDGLFIALTSPTWQDCPFAAQLTIKGLIIIAASAAHSWIGAAAVVAARTNSQHRELRACADI